MVYSSQKYSGGPIGSNTYQCQVIKDVDTRHDEVGQMHCVLELSAAPRLFGMPLTIPSVAWSDMWVVARAEDDSWIALGDGDHRTRCIILARDPNAGDPEAPLSYDHTRTSGEGSHVADATSVLERRGYAASTIVATSGRLRG